MVLFLKTVRWRKIYNILRFSSILFLCSSYFNIMDLIALTILVEQYKPPSLLMTFPSIQIPFLFGLNFRHRILFSIIFSLCSSFRGALLCCEKKNVLLYS